MKRLNKKAFTIIELVVVIAVLAILVSVLIPTFASVVRKANESADTQLVRNLNTCLLMDKSEGHTHTTYQSVLDVVYNNGYDVARIMTAKATSNTILWDSVNDVFCYLKDGEVKYIPGTEGEKLQANDYRLWKVYANNAEYNSLASEGYSVYAATSSDWTNITLNGKSFDSGKNSRLGTVTYNGVSEQRTITIRTNGQMSTLNVNGLGGENGDTVNHYGFINTTNVISVGTNDCYHEYGTSNVLVGTAGKIVVESTGNVFKMDKAESATAVFYNNGGNVLSAEAGTLTNEKQTLTTYSINSYEQLCSFRDATNSGMTFAGITVELNCDITLTEPWKPISNFYRKTNANGGLDQAFAGTFDGKNHTVSGLTNEGLTMDSINTGYNNTTPQGGTEYIYGFFATVNNATIKNINFTNVNIINIDGLLGDCNAACVGMINVTNTDEDLIQIENINVSGNISGYDNVAGVVGMARNVTAGVEVEHYFTIKGCTFNGTLTATRRSAGIIAQFSSSVYKASLIDCTATGSASSSRSKDGNLDLSSYYLCGGLAIWGQTTRLYVDECTSNMSVFAEAITGETGLLYDKFIMVEVTSPLAGETSRNYTNSHVTGSGYYYKEKNTYAVKVVEE